jgi:hypothetical protein
VPMLLPCLPCLPCSPRHFFDLSLGAGAVAVSAPPVVLYEVIYVYTGILYASQRVQYSTDDLVGCTRSVQKGAYSSSTTLCRFSLLLLLSLLALL